MKILHVTPSFHPAYIYGGTTRSVYDLCRNLARAGCEVKVLTTDANGPDAVLDVDTGSEVQIEDGIIVRYCHRIMDVSVSPKLPRLLPSYLRWADVVHLMAVYSFPTIPTLLACKVMRKPVVWSPRGMLQRWESTRRPWLKAAWERVCRVAAPKRLTLHVTSEQEAAESRQRLPGIDSIVIPNGIEIPGAVQHVESNRELRLVYLGRIHPKKGIENLLEAYKMLNGNLGKTPSLSIAGDGEPRYVDSIRARVEQLSPSRSVKMIGPVHGESKESLFRNADVVVVPSHTENFGLVVAEALAHGVPVIASKGTPWSRVEEIGCGLWIDNDPQSLAAGIERIAAMPLQAMGDRGREWIGREFSWHLVAEQTMQLYRDVMRA
ncbi:MAG TPA: glycosyltransferase [Blastocatellia bacterium]|nr:glycosyltransferase [Blastocatellia bacterium]